jgi:hypothetical protein
MLEHHFVVFFFPCFDRIYELRLVFLFPVEMLYERPTNSLRSVSVVNIKRLV